MAKKKQSTLYFFYTIGCAFCKRVMPFVDELISEGVEILKLDLAEEDNKNLEKEIKKKFDIKCGTPLFVDAKTGNYFCGFREKDIIKKWSEGEKIPEPPRPTGPAPKVPFQDATQEELKKWKKEYNEWTEKNSKLSNIKTASELLKMPRPKSDPPRPPMGNQSPEQLKKWKEEYEKWYKENQHLPNILPPDAIMNRIEMMKNRQQGAQPGSPQVSPNIEKRLTAIENNLNKLIRHLGVK